MSYLDIGWQVGGTVDCGLGLGIVWNAFALADMACDKTVSTMELVMSAVESAVIVG